MVRLRRCRVNTPENRMSVQDYEKCDNLSDVKRVLAQLNYNGWSLVCVTPDPGGGFLVFFRRSAV